jgi:5-methylcytosine-specific restriction endonuclease McrA
MNLKQIFMTKREKIFNKFDGKCAYCACELQKGWHVDHFLPLVRGHKGEQQYPERNEFENLMPSCPSCNNYKNSYNIEEFRRLISELRKQLMLSTQYKISLRYGLINEVEKEVEFYFENVNRNG